MGTGIARVHPRLLGVLLVLGWPCRLGATEATDPRLNGLDGGIDPAAVAECAALEPRACFDHAMEVLQPDGGLADWKRGLALLREACRRGAQPGCAPPLTRPKPIEPVKLEYPRAMQLRGVTGAVTVKCTILVDGRVRDCRIIHSPAADLSAAVLAALASARYEPVTLAGRPVPVSYVFHFNFRDRDDPPTRLEEVPIWKPVLDQELLYRCIGNFAEECHHEAQRLAEPPVAPGSAARAARLFGAACWAKYEASCSVLRSRFLGPKRLSSITVSRGTGELVCWISALGKAHGCRATKSSPFDDLWIHEMEKGAFQTAMLDGVPFETEYLFSYGPAGPQVE
jgi:TonB family protein